MLHPKAVANVAPRSSCPEVTGLSLTHSSLFLRTCPSMGSSTRDDDAAGVVCPDPIQGASPEQGRPPRGKCWSSGSGGYLLRFFCRVKLAGSLLHVALLDYLICPPQQCRRDRQAERLGGLEVDDQFDLLWLLDR